MEHSEDSHHQVEWTWLNSDVINSDIINSDINPGCQEACSNI